MTSVLTRVDEIASRQWSLVTREQLRDAEVSNSSIARLLKTGALRRVEHSVYATLGSPRSWERDTMASVLAADRTLSLLMQRPHDFGPSPMCLSTLST